MYVLRMTMLNILSVDPENMVYTHYHNSNLIWCTVSRRVDEVIPPETRSVEGDQMVWPHPRDVILYARSSYYYDNMFIICLFSDILSDFKAPFGL